MGLDGDASVKSRVWKVYVTKDAKGKENNELAAVVTEWEWVVEVCLM